MSLRLTLVSHAATAATRQVVFPADEALDPRSADKAAALMGTLGRVDTAWTSPALRAVQTATALGLDAALDPALADLHMPLWSGRSLADIEASDAAGLLQWATDPTASPHGGESVENLLERVTIWLDSIANRHGRLVAVTHAALIRAAIIIVLDANPKSFWRIDVEPLRFVTILRRSGYWTLSAFRSKDVHVAP